MIRRVAVDAGKSETKVAEYMEKLNVIRKFMFSTKTSDGDFRDDAIEQNTHLIEIEGKCYKVGSGASGNGADNKRNKVSDTHKIAILTALAKIASSKEEDEFRVAIGIPAEDWCNVETREFVRSELLPMGKITVKYRDNSASEVVTKTFTINKDYRKVYAEGLGALCMDDSIEIPESDGAYIGVIDIGSLNCSAVVWNGNAEILKDYTITKDLGSKKLQQKLASKLTTELGVNVTELTANSILRKRPENRRLVLNNGNKEIEEKSKAIIKATLTEFVEEIKSECELRNWDLDVMPLVCSGGTAAMLADELSEVFGSHIVIVRNAVFCNALGYLSTLCVQDSSLKIDTEDGCIPLSNIIDLDKEGDKTAA